jgi:hypothetical protein
VINTQTSKKEVYESKNLDTTQRGVWRRKFRSTYLERESAKERKMMARFTCGNDERKNKYWMEGEERRCRMCYDERATIEYRNKRKGVKYWIGRREIKWMKEIWNRERKWKGWRIEITTCYKKWERNDTSWGDYENKSIFLMLSFSRSAKHK